MNPRTLFSPSAGLAGVVLVLAWVPALKAHEFLIKSGQLQVKSGAQLLLFSLMATDGRGCGFSCVSTTNLFATPFLAFPRAPIKARAAKLDESSHHV